MSLYPCRAGLIIREQYLNEPPTRPRPVFHAGAGDGQKCGHLWPSPTPRPREHATEFKTRGGVEELAARQPSGDAEAELPAQRRAFKNHRSNRAPAVCLATRAAAPSSAVNARCASRRMTSRRSGALSRMPHTRCVRDRAGRAPSILRHGAAARYRSIPTVMNSCRHSGSVGDTTRSKPAPPRDSLPKVARADSLKKRGVCGTARLI